MKTYEIVFKAEDVVDDDGDCVLWLKTDYKVKLPRNMNIELARIREIDIPANLPGIDIIVE